MNKRANKEKILNLIYDQVISEADSFYYLLWFYDMTRAHQLSFKEPELDMDLSAKEFSQLILGIYEGRATQALRSMLAMADTCHHEFSSRLADVWLIPSMASASSLAALLQNWHQIQLDDSLQKEKDILEFSQALIEQAVIFGCDLSGEFHQRHHSVDETDLVILYLLHFEFSLYLEETNSKSLQTIYQEKQTTLRRKLRAAGVLRPKTWQLQGERQHSHRWRNRGIFLLIVSLCLFLLMEFYPTETNQPKDSMLYSVYKATPGIKRRIRRAVMRFTPGQTTQKTPTATPTKPATQETKPELHRPDRVRDRVESYLRRPDKYKPIPGIIPLFPSKTNPGKDFWTTRDGLNLYSAAENNANLRNYFRRHQGLSSSRKTDSVINYLTDNYYKIKFHPRVSWAIVDMETGKMVGWQVNRNFEGASVVKVWPMASLFDKMGGFPNASQIATMLQMIAVSSNSAWSQTIYYNADQGGGNKAKSGYHRIQQFLKKYGYTKTKGGRISIGAGQSAINTRDLTHYLFDLNHNRLPGSEAQLKLMATCRTANKKGFRYAPSGVFGGGKTGTYSQLAHDLRWYEINGKRYGIAVLTQLSASPGYSGSPSGSNNFRNESVAILHGGLLREYIYTNLGAVFPTTASEKKEFWQGNYNGGIAKVKDGEKPSL